MTGARAMWLISALALVCLGGIVGMLLADSGWDWLFFAMATSPLASGCGWWWRHRSKERT
ncbi:MAG: hypothetical protein QM581_10675 [Pseudomonas sp.]